MRALLKIRDARIFLAGWTASQFGDWAMIIVLAVWAKSLTDSNASAGLVFFALAAPSIFAPLAGLVVDRVRRRPLLVGVYSIEAVVVLGLLFVHDRGDVWILYAMAVFTGTAGTLAALGALGADDRDDPARAARRGERDLPVGTRRPSDRRARWPAPGSTQPPAGASSRSSTRRASSSSSPPS